MPGVPSDDIVSGLSDQVLTHADRFASQGVGFIPFVGVGNRGNACPLAARSRVDIREEVLRARRALDQRDWSPSGSGVRTEGPRSHRKERRRYGSNDAWGRSERWTICKELLGRKTEAGAQKRHVGFDQSGTTGVLSRSVEPGRSDYVAHHV